MARTKNLDLQIALSHATSALELIASSTLWDGTYLRDRRACEVLASDALAAVQLALAAQVEAEPLSPLPSGSAKLSQYVECPGKITLYTDGGCKGNPGPAGWGAVLVDEDGKMLREACGFIGVATNQVAELRAAIEGLSLVPIGAHVELVSDSQYVLKSLSEWRAGWERRGWFNSSNEPVKNEEIMRQYFAAADLRKVTVRWVKGHSGNHFNERCDVLANQAISSRVSHTRDSGT